MTDTPPSTTATRSARDTFAGALEPMLGGQLQRLRRRYLWHGSGYLLLLPAVAIAVFFLLDHTLRLPVAIRLLHTVAVVTLAAYACTRFVIYPMSRRFAALDIAQVLESAYPELHQRLVSAVQLANQQGGALRNQSAAMIDALVAETAEAAQRLPLDRFFDSRRTTRILTAAAAFVLLLGFGAASAPDTARAFVLRHLGVAADYPRQTYLTVDLPPAGPELQRRDRDGVTELLLPAGGELHVSVLAEGDIPKEVFLDITALNIADDRADKRRRRGPRSVPMTPRPGNRFRHVFRKVSGAFEFHARGGDDENGDRLVRVRTIRPPQIATIRATVSPPAYTGIETVNQEGGGVEALVGSEVELLATTTAAVQSATMVFLESGRQLELEPVMMQDDSGDATAYRTRFTLQGSDRYQIELLGGNGLRNPEPGTYPIAALQDYAPVGRWLLPAEQNLLLLPTALLCVRLEARDDFGLLGVDLRIERAGTTVHEAPLLAAPSPNGDGNARAFAQQTVLTTLVEMQELLAQGTGGASASDGLSVGLVVRDNCQPLTGTVELPRRIVQVVDAPQLAEAIGKRFRRLREEVASALDIQLDRRQRLEDLLAGAATPAEAANVLSSVEVGQSRVLGSCERLHQGLMVAFDDHLWNRLEASANAPAVVELYREFSARLVQPLARDPDFYRELARQRQDGTIGALETALDPILQMIVTADVLATTDGPRAARLLAQVQVSRVTERDDLIREAMARQQQIAAALQALLYRLEEWNDYQDLVREARALRDRQRDLRLRTEELRDKK